MLSGSIDEAGVLVTALRIEPQRGLIHQHVRKADDRIERRTQLVAHRREKPGFRSVGAFGLGTSLFKSLHLPLTLCNITKHGNDFAATAGLDRRLLQRSASHLDPYELRSWAAVCIKRFTPYTEFGGTAFAQRCSVTEGGQIGRAIGNMDAAEQALSV